MSRLRWARLGLAGLGGVAVGTLMLASSAPARVAYAPVPRPGAVPGALPADFVYEYAEDARGWPVRPRDQQHPIRGSFLDPRGPDHNGLSGYHFGVDVNVDDAHPEPGAPSGATHRVYALESGVAAFPADDLTRQCGNRRMDIGHFSYWHVTPTVKEGERVRAGQQIAWTCKGEWHVHISEWQAYEGTRVWVHPLHRGGKLVPYGNTRAPVVSGLEFRGPPSSPWRPEIDLDQPDTSELLDNDALRGRVELRAQASVPQSSTGFLRRDPRYPTAHHPHRLDVTITAARTGKVVLQRTAWQVDRLPVTPYFVHWAPGSEQNEPMEGCVEQKVDECRGVHIFRPFSRFRLELWDTRTVPNGRYRVTVTAWSIIGKAGRATIDVTVAN